VALQLMQGGVVQLSDIYSLKVAGQLQVKEEPEAACTRAGVMLWQDMQSVLAGPTQVRQLR
jgi:hypothetical protein